MRVVFMGTPQFAVESLVQVVKSGYAVVGVVTQPDRPKGRGKKLLPPPVKEKALELGLPIYQPEKVKEADFIRQLQELKPDVILVVAFGQILSKTILDLPPLGCINVHASLLPKYRGAAPIHWSIINGEKETGITTMYMNEGLDTGDILLKAKVTIGPDTTTGELHDKLAVLGGQVLVETLEKLKKDELTPQPQQEKLASYAPLLTKEHEKINWNKDAEEVHNLIRGMNPWPGAYTTYKGQRLKIWQTLLSKEISHKGTTGEILVVTEEGFWVQTKDKPLLIVKVQPAGKKAMDAKDFINGFGVSSGQILGDNNE